MAFIFFKDTATSPYFACYEDERPFCSLRLILPTGPLVIMKYMQRPQAYTHWKGFLRARYWHNAATANMRLVVLDTAGIIVSIGLSGR
jgi:hypothetical protein